MGLEAGDEACALVLVRACERLGGLLDELGAAEEARAEDEHKGRVLLGDGGGGVGTETTLIPSAPSCAISSRYMLLRAVAVVPAPARPARPLPEAGTCR